MRKCLIVSLMLGFVFALSASTTPMDPYSAAPTYGAYNGVRSSADQPGAGVLPPTNLGDVAFYHSLELLTFAEKQNAVIGIEFMGPVSREAAALARGIENLWNNGQFDDALAKLALLNDMDGVAGNALVGISWRTPIPAPQPTWGTDVLVNPRDSVIDMAFDHAIATNYLYALIGIAGDGMASRWFVCMSTDGGHNWVETYALGGFTYVMNDMDACFVGSHFQVLYTGGSSGAPNQMLWYKRFKAADGTQDTMPNGSTSYNIYTGNTVTHVDFSSNQENYNNRLYCYFIDNTGALLYYWNNLTTVTWNQVATGVTDALQGLDSDWNANYTTNYLIMSYIDNTDSVIICVSNGTWSRSMAYYINDTPFLSYYTSVGGHNDTLFCAFDYHGTTYNEARYLIQYGSGSWLWGNVGPTTENCWVPDATLRGSGGIHTVCRGGSVTTGYYRYRPYSGGWSTPLAFNDNNMSGEIHPVIEYVGNSAYGILYRTPTANSALTYFDRSDWLGVAEQAPVEKPRFITLAPNPAKGLVTLTVTLKTEGTVKISVYDVTGSLVKVLMNESKPAGTHSLAFNNSGLVSGTYFVRAVTPDGSSMSKLTLIK